MSTRILIADDHHILRQGLRSLLEREPDFTVVADAANGVRTLELIDQHQPDVAVIDVSMPDMDGIEATRQIRARDDIKIVALSMHTEPRFVCDMIRAGASAYLLKD